MDEQNQDVVESLNPQEEIAEEVVETVEESETSQPDEIEELRKRAALADDYKKRAEIAEREAKKLKSEPVHSKPALSSADLLAVTNAKVHEDDIEKLERYAKAEKLSIKDALRDPEWQAIQALRDENRSMANAANISNVRAGHSTVSDDVLLKNANSGKLPESDLEIERLILAKSRANQG